MPYMPIYIYIYIYIYTNDIESRVRQGRYILCNTTVLSLPIVYASTQTNYLNV